MFSLVSYEPHMGTQHLKRKTGSFGNTVSSSRFAYKQATLLLDCNRLHFYLTPTNLLLKCLQLYHADAKCKLKIISFLQCLCQKMPHDQLGCSQVTFQEACHQLTALPLRTELDHRKRPSVLMRDSAAPPALVWSQASVQPSIKWGINSIQLIEF